eukprot:Gb_01697 [translate_table: standard]
MLVAIYQQSGTSSISSSKCGVYKISVGIATVQVNTVKAFQIHLKVSSGTLCEGRPWPLGIPRLLGSNISKKPGAKRLQSNRVLGLLQIIIVLLCVLSWIDGMACVLQLGGYVSIYMLALIEKSQRLESILFGPSLYGIFPYAGLKFYVYEELKSHVPKEHEKSLLAKLACGSLAGLVGQTLTYPLDVVRRQMQVQSLSFTQNGASSLQLMEPELKGTFEGLVTIVQRQGWKQMFAGLSINYLKVVPSVAIGFTAYDGMKSWLGVPLRENVHS